MGLVGRHLGLGLERKLWVKVLCGGVGPHTIGKEIIVTMLVTLSLRGIELRLLDKL